MDLLDMFDDLDVSGKRIAIVEINGMIISPKGVVEKLERYIKNDDIPAIVIRLNTPGGGVSATQEIFETVKKARHAGKKVIASMGTVAASGGYYIAAACDTVMANPATITGSIGVIATFPNFTELYRKIGIDYNVIKSGKFKDTGSSSREMTDEERAYLDGLIMDTYEQFLLAVSQERNLSLDFIRNIAEGKIFTGRQALEQGLIDSLGTYQDAVDLAGVLVGLGENPPVLKETRGVFWEIIADGMSDIISKGFEFKFPSISYMLTY